MLFLNKNGQTITEMLVAFTIAAVVSALSAVIVGKSLHSYKIIKAEDEIMKVGELMLYTMFEADQEGLIDANAVIALNDYPVANNPSIRFTDKTGTKTIRIWRDTTDTNIIYKDVNGASQIDLDINDTVNVTGFTVSGYNKDENPASGSTVQRVHIQLQLTAKEATERVRIITLDSSQKLRRVCNL